MYFLKLGLQILQKWHLRLVIIDLYNDYEFAARFYGEERNVFSCKVYTTLEDLDFEVDSIFMQEEVRGTVYCRDKDTKEPVWIVSRGDEGGSWWEVNRVPEFYKNQFKNQNMTREEAKEFYPFLQAFAEGRVIECRTKPSLIEGSDVPNDWTEMKEIEYWNNIEYRIKQEPKYRPFKNAEECWQEMLKHQPFGWIKMLQFQVNS